MGDGGRPAAARGAVPVQWTRFFGREREIDGLAELFTRERLVTLVGAPGCGKTRLAISVATYCEPLFPGGVRFVDLAAIRDPAAVPTAIAIAGDIGEEQGRAQDEVLLAVLQDTAPILLVLDNCEHVLDTVAPLARRLVERCSAVSVLATSRSALDVDSEVVWQVPPLDVVSATRLFMDRAVPLSGAAFEPGDEAVVQAICRGLDCLPLAVELTAAWSRALSPGQILDRLSGDLPDHGRARRGDEPRHVSMAEAIDWSYRPLPPDVQALFRASSVFAGGFDLDAAIFVAGGEDGEVLNCLRSLVDDSLVLSERFEGGSMRYRLLEPVRQHAATLLAAAGEEEAIRRRHHDYYLALAEGYDPWPTRRTLSTTSLAQLQREDANLHSAFGWGRGQPGDAGLRFGAAMAPYWTYGGRSVDGLRWMHEVIADEADDQELLARALTRSGLLAFRQASYEEAEALVERALALAAELGEDELWASAMNVMGGVEFATGRFDAAVEHLQEAITILESSGGDAVGTGGMISLGWAYGGRGDLDEASEVFGSLLEADRVGDPTAAAFGHFGLAYVALMRREVAAQREHLAAALVAMDEGGVVEHTDWLWASITLAGGERRSRTAYRLFGAAMVYGQRRGGSRLPQSLSLSSELFDALFLPVRRDVHPSEREDLMAEGREMTWEELTAQALAEPTGPPSPLTPREEHIAELVAGGLTNADISRKLGISRRTVESHLDHIKQKLGLASRNEVIIWAHGGLGEPRPYK